MEAPNRVVRLLLVLLAFVLLLASATMAWAVAADLDQSDTIPEGVRVILPRGEVLAIGGLTRAAAAATMTAHVLRPVLSPVVVRYEDRAFYLDPRDQPLVSVNTEAMLDQAFRARQETAFAVRVYRDVTRRAQTVDIEPRYAVDQKRANAFVARIASQIDTKPVDALRQVVGNELVITRSTAGAAVKRKAASQTISRMLLDTDTVSKIVSLPVGVLEPKVAEESFGEAIVVDKSERRLYLYDGAKLAKTYRVAVGMPGFPTPLGTFEIVQKRFRPTWSNPGSAWAKDMPAYIPPGPSNPLGTRALNLNAPGIRIHGTNKISSIGTAASHGCIRMLRDDIEQLYELVGVKTPVFIVP